MARDKSPHLDQIGFSGVGALGLSHDLGLPKGLQSQEGSWPVKRKCTSCAFCLLVPLGWPVKSTVEIFATLE